MPDREGLVKLIYDAAARAATGKTEDELFNESKTMYPGVAKGSRHHRLAAKLMAERFGPIGASAAQPLGVAVEGLEVLGGSRSNPDWATDTKEDLRQNFQGAMEGLTPLPQTPQTEAGKLAALPLKDMILQMLLRQGR